MRLTIISHACHHCGTSGAVVWHNFSISWAWAAVIKVKNAQPHYKLEAFELRYRRKVVVKRANKKKSDTVARIKSNFTFNCNKSYDEENMEMRREAK